MKNQKLPREIILNCRLLNKWTKNSVDEAIYHETPNGIDDEDFRNMEDIQNFNARAEGFVGNPFITRQLMIHLLEEEEIQMVLDILQRFGHELWNLYLHLPQWDPLPFWHHLSQTLNRVPNIRRLHISFPWIEEDDESWTDFVTQPNTFPAFEGLMELSLISRKLLALNEGDSVRMSASAVRPLLLAYGEQLTTLEVDCFVFRGDPWESFHFPNLTKLDICFDSPDGHVEAYNNMKDLDCPQLKTLKLRGGNCVLSRHAFGTKRLS